MRKKYLSALLFGALLFASAGTFTSCKDYDDDIKDLQEQINTISTTLESLEAQVSDKGVTSVTFDETTGVLTVVDGDGSHTYTVKTSAGEVGEITVAIDGQDLVVNGEVVGQVGDKVAVNEEGELTVNGEGTGITVGQYAILEDDSNNMYTITLPNSKGELQTIQLPKATASITEVEIMGYCVDGDLKQASTEIKYNRTRVASLSNDLKEWNKEEDVRKVAEGQVLSTLGAWNTSLMMRLAPATLDASGLSFTLVNSKLEAAPIALDAPKAYEGLLTRASVNNGVWTLATTPEVDAVYDDVTDYDANFKTSDNKKIAFALKEANGFVSNYDLTFKLEGTMSLDAQIEKVNGEAVQGSTNAARDNNRLQSTTAVNKVNVGKVELTFNHPVYDAHLHFDDATIQRWAITDINGTSFTVGKRPDDITSANFQVNVHYVTLKGEVKNEWIPMTVAKSFAGQTVLAQTDHMINAEASKDKFAVSLDNMFTDLGTNEALWKSDVTKATVELYQVGTAADGKDKEITIPTAPAISFTVADKDGKDATSDLSKATQIIADFKQNWPATGDDYALDESYYVLVSFMDANNDVLNTVKVPFTMNIPALSTFLQKQQGVFNGTNDGTAYVFGTTLVNTDAKGSALPLQYDLSYAFVGGLKNLGTTTIKFKTNGYIDGDTNNSKGALVEFVNASKTTYADSDVAMTFDANKAALVAKADKNNDVYGQVFEIEVSSAAYLGKYTYSEDARKAETFTIKMLSPIKEGKISAADGSQTINVTATDNQMIKESAFHAETYAAVAYELFPSATTKKASQIYDWISYNALSGTITIVPEDDRVLKVTEIKNTVDATTTAEEVEGYVKVEPVNPAYDTTGDIIVTVNDVWGFSNKQNITVNIAR